MARDGTSVLRGHSRGRFHAMAGLIPAALAMACAGETGPTGVAGDEPGGNAPLCTIPIEEIFDGGVGRDGIRSLENPELVAVDHDEARYLLPDDRVVGVEIDGQAIAIPHNILWWHEIVNFDLGGPPVAVSFCPLTGSSLVFDRSAIGGSEMGVSGLIFRNNLIMFDRDSDSLWPQMMRASACGDLQRTELPLFPSVEMSWAAWKALHPDGLVISEETGRFRNYRRYPYGAYDELGNPETLFPQPVPHDERREPKERVLGVIQGSDGGTAFPFGLLRLAEKRAIAIRAPGGDAVLFWDRAAEGAAAYFRDVDGQALTFSVNSGQIVDGETGSVWTLDGLAVDGPLEGKRLRWVADSYVSFWFAWATFQPETVVWDP